MWCVVCVCGVVLCVWCVCGVVWCCFFSSSCVCECACVSPLAKGDVFSPYTENVLNMVRESGAEMIETEKPIDFLDRVQEFLEQI